jgi:hypothetical protein
MGFELAGWIENSGPATGAACTAFIASALTGQIGSGHGSYLDGRIKTRKNNRL